MKKIITEKKNRLQVFESKMRAWKYLDDINKACEFFIYNKENILKLDEWVQYSIGNDFVIKIANDSLFRATYPMQANAGGFMNNGQLILKMFPHYTVKILKSTILHELEHAIDYRENYHEIERDQQQAIQGIAYQSVYNPKKVDDPIEQELEIQVRYILYHYWVDTEKNAFVSRSLSSPYTIEKQINDDFKRLKWIENTDADKYASFWFQMQTLLINRKRGVDTIYKVVPKNIKKHFIKQSYHKIKQYQNTVNKKLIYAKMNNLGVASTTMYNTQQLPPLPPTSPLQESKLHNIIIDVLNEMKAFHGTSARFNKFKSDYNLSGEGSESFGPGHYFTASKQIGKDYANEHGTSKVEIPRFKYSGCGGDAIYQSHQLFEDINKLIHLDEYDKEHNNYLWRNLYPLMCTCETKGKLIRTIYQYVLKAVKSKEDYEEDKFWYDLRLDDLLKLLRENIVETTRELYQVDIPDEDKYADWNDIVDNRMFDYASSLIESTKDADRNFEQINKSLGNYLEKNQDITYDIFWKCLNNMNYDGSVGDNIFKLTLKRFGYVGVKYPSGQNFQTSSTKDGDMNYTVFDDDNVKITNRWDL